MSRACGRLLHAILSLAGEPPRPLALCVCCLNLQLCYVCFTSLSCMQEPPQPTKSAKAKLGQPTVKPQDSVSSCLHVLHN